jgi:hypothetical protein
VGKSALGRAGLWRSGVLRSAMVPVLIEGLGEDWIDRPSRRLAEALRALDESERTKLELTLGAELAGTRRACRHLGCLLPAWWSSPCSTN